MKRAEHRIVGLAVALLLTGAMGVRAQVQGELIKKGNPQAMIGTIRWQPASKSYLITARGASLTIPYDQVEKLRIPVPPALETARGQVQGGQAGQAIGALEKIVADYTMLEHDLPAGRLLAEAYLKTGVAAKAIEMCEKLLKDNPTAAYSADFAPLYWQALQANGRDALLKRALAEAVQKGTRELAAQAQIMRGDIEKKNGNLKDALVDGYLRTAVLFQDVKAVQPEALYKAMKCFEELGQAGHAEKMRRRLLAEFPQDPLADRARAGG